MTLLFFWVLAMVDANVSKKHTVCIVRAGYGALKMETVCFIFRNVGIYPRVYTAPKPRRTAVNKWKSAFWSSFIACSRTILFTIVMRLPI
jgi:hypothetical protein